MLGKKEFIGLTIQDDAIHVAHLKVSGKKTRLIKLDRFSLVEEIKTEKTSPELQGEAVFEDSGDADSIFGLDDEQADGGDELDDLNLDDLDGLDDLEDLDSESEAPGQGLSLDMVEESDSPSSNELLLFNILSGLELGKIQLGLNIPAGNTIFQIIRDANFNEVKKKDLISDLEDKLESIYGERKSKDNYSYEIREDGSLLLASVDHESTTLQLTNRTLERYDGKVSIEDVVPDEVLLVGLLRDNYELQPDEITGIVQFGKKQCRIIFMKGKEIWLVSPVINEGTEKKNFLNTVFSKILFQLDTGEVPSLDRIILTNNTIGEEAVNFFKGSFPDIFVESLSFKEDFIDEDNVEAAAVPAFTTAIGAALAASRTAKESFPSLHFLPSYVDDRQKIFKLEWHGLMILLLIFLTPITFNYFYNKNVSQIESLTADLNSMEAQIEAITPIVENTNELSSQLSGLKNKLVLLDTLSSGSREWSQKLQILNEGIQGLSNTWLTTFKQEGDEVFIQGYTLFRNRIPQVVNIFDEATLLSVSIEKMREKEVFSFSIVIRRFTATDSIYSPPTPAEVQKLIAS